MFKMPISGYVRVEKGHMVDSKPCWEPLDFNSALDSIDMGQDLS